MAGKILGPLPAFTSSRVLPDVLAFGLYGACFLTGSTPQEPGAFRAELIVISEGPYSNVPASETPYGDLQAKPNKVASP